MSKTKRRAAVVAALCVASLVGLQPDLPPAIARGQDKTGPASVDQVHKALELTAEREKKSPLTPDTVPFLTPVDHKAVGKGDRPEENIEPEVEEFKTPKGEAFATALRYTCNPAKLNMFTVGGQPLVARRFSYSVPQISWSAGDGHPVLRTYCPYDSYSSRNYYPHAKSAQVVPSIAGQNYFVGCASSAVCQSAAAGQVCFAVNDSYYPDNRGYFVVIIHSWNR